MRDVLSGAPESKRKVSELKAKQRDLWKFRRNHEILPRGGLK